MKLHPTLTLAVQQSETPASFASRIAFKLGRTAYDFAREMDTTFQAIVDGDPRALAALCDTCSVERGAFQAGVMTRVDDRLFSLAGETFPRAALARSAIAVCPACIAEDLVGPDGQFGPYGRRLWTIASVRACPRHRVVLQDAVFGQAPAQTHDFAWHLHMALSNGQVDPGKAECVSQTLVAEYVEARLSGEAPASWLNDVPLYAVTRFAEVLGAAIDDASGDWSDLSRLRQHNAGEVGFAVLLSGAQSVVDAFGGMRKTRGDGKRQWAPRDVYGRLYDFLAYDNVDTAFDLFRGLLHDHIVNTMPIAAGEVLLGKRVATRTLHSIHSVSVETGMHPKTLKKRLTALGEISHADLAMSDDHILFDAGKVSAILASSTELLSKNRAAEHLNVARPMDTVLLTPKYVPIVERPGAKGKKSKGYLAADLDNFLDSLLENASKLAGGETGFYPLTACAKRASTSSTQILDLILAKKLIGLRIDPNARGVMSLLIDPTEVDGLVHPEQMGDVSLREVERRLQTSTAVVKNLLEAGYLPSRVTKNSRTNLPTRVVLESVLAEFMSTFASLHTLRPGFNLHFDRLKSALDDYGVRPCFDTNLVPATFYRRDAIEPHWQKLVQLAA